MLIFSLVSPAFAEAQTIWTGMERPEGLQVELHHPELDSFDFGELTNVLFLGGRLAASPVLNIVADLPLAYADFAGSSDFAVGAPYFGVERSEGSTLLEVGIRLPIASDNFGSSVGSVIETVDRLGAFSSNAAVVSATGTLGGTTSSGFVRRVRIGPRALIASGGGDLFVDYGGVLGYATPHVGFEGGVVGWILLTEDGEIGERTVHEGGLQLFRPLRGGGRLGLLFRLPLDHDTSTSVEFIIGILATIPTR